LSLASARPQNTNLRDVIKEASEDIVTAVVSKTGALSFVGDTALNVTLNVTNSALDILSDIDFEGALNGTEDKVKANKVAMIEALFDAKRQVIRTLGNLTTGFGDLYVSAVNQIDSAVTATVDGLVLSKEFAGNLSIAQVQDGALTATNWTAETVSDFTDSTAETISDLGDSIGEAISDVGDFVDDTYDATIDAIEETGQALIYSMLGVKQQLHELSENFDSQEGLNTGILNIGLSLNASLSTAEGYAAQFGVFQAMDNMVQAVGQIPMKVNNFLASVFGSETANPEDYADFEDMEDIENEDILEEEDLGNDPEVMPRSSGSDFVISDDQGILRFLRKEKEFWDKISELL